MGKVMRKGRSTRRKPSGKRPAGKRTRRGIRKQSRRRRGRKQRGGEPDMVGTDILNLGSLSYLDEGKVQRLVAAAEQQLSQASGLLSDFDRLTAEGPTAGYWAWMSNLAGIRITDRSAWGYTEPGKIEALRTATTNLEGAISEVNRAIRGELIFRQQYMGDNDEPTPMDWRSAMGKSLITGTGTRSTGGLLNRSRKVSEVYWPAQRAYDAIVAKIAEDKRIAAEYAAQEQAVKDEAFRKGKGQMYEDRLPGRNLVGDPLPRSEPESWGEWAGSWFAK